MTAGDPTPKTVLIRCNSHRARQKMERAIGKQVGYYSLQRAGSFYRVSPMEFETVKDIAGLSRARDGADIHRCWAGASAGRATGYSSSATDTCRSASRKLARPC